MLPVKTSYIHSTETACIPMRSLVQWWIAFPLLFPSKWIFPRVWEVGTVVTIVWWASGCQVAFQLVFVRLWHQEPILLPSFHLGRPERSFTTLCCLRLFFCVPLVFLPRVALFSLFILILFYFLEYDYSKLCKIWATWRMNDIFLHFNITKFYSCLSVKLREAGLAGERLQWLTCSIWFWDFF